MHHGPPPLVYRLCATNIPADVRPELFYHTLRVFFRSLPSQPAGAHASSPPGLLKNALLIAPPPSPRTDTSAPVVSVRSPTEAEWPLTAMALVDVTEAAVALALCEGQTVCTMDQHVLRWRLVRPVAPAATSTNSAEEAETLSRVQSDPAVHTREEEEEEEVVRLCTVSGRTASGVYGTALAALGHDVDEDVPLLDSARGASAGTAPLAGPPLIALHRDMEEALHRLMQPSGLVTDAQDVGRTHARYVLGLRRLARGEVHLRVRHTVAARLRLHGESDPLTVYHHYDGATEDTMRAAEGTVNAAPDADSTSCANAQASTSTSATASPHDVTPVSALPVRTLWDVQPTPRRRVDGFLLDQIAAATTSSRGESDGSATTRGNGARKRGAPSALLATPCWTEGKQARTETQAQPSVCATSRPSSQGLRLASKAEVLTALAAMMTETAGKIGAWQDAYGNLFFPSEVIKSPDRL